MLFALFVVTSIKDAEGFAGVIAMVSVLFLLGGIGTKKPADQLVNAQAAWDKRWICARCGHQWEE